MDKGRFKEDKKSDVLVQAEKQAIKKNAPKALYELALKELNQDAALRT